MGATFAKKTYSVRELARDVGVLAGRAREVGAIMSGDTIDPALRESIMVAVARTNECRYCVYAHEDAARHEGLSDTDLDHLAGTEWPDADPAWVVALSYARALAAADFGPVDGELVAAVLEAYGEEGRERIETTARLMTVANRCGNTVDALASRLAGNPAPGGRLCDEVAVSALWVVGAIPTAWNIWRGRGGSPFALLADFLAFDRRFKEAVRGRT